VLLCFGDYSQDVEVRVKLMAPGKIVIRKFLTKPAYSKGDFMTKTSETVLRCLDFFISNTETCISDKISATLGAYALGAKDWRYYFIKYASFRSGCNLGFYDWKEGEYCLWKMKERQRNGSHWDPFLQALKDEVASEKLTLENYGSGLVLADDSGEITITSHPAGFVFQNTSAPLTASPILENLQRNNLIDSDGLLRVLQKDGIDLSDRIQEASKVLVSLLT
jgi:hypothetical protein